MPGLATSLKRIDHGETARGWVQITVAAREKDNGAIVDFERETMDNEKAWIAFIVEGNVIEKVACSKEIPLDLWYHLQDNPPTRGDSTYIAAFVFDDGPPTGKLENTMPGSDLEYFSFEKARLLGKEIVVGRYW